MKNYKIDKTIIEKAERKALIKRSKTGKDYFSYSEEVGCDVWETLKGMESMYVEPVCIWLPEDFITIDTSEYVEGVEVPIEFNGDVLEGFDVIVLPAAKYIEFRSEPYED